MDGKVLQEVLENVNLIKGIMDKTKKSFTAFSKIFVCWGILFIINSILHFLMVSNSEQIQDILSVYPVIVYIFPVGITALVAALIYRHISKKIPLIGLEKHLMKVWLLVLAMNAIPQKVEVYTANNKIDMSAITVQVNSFSVMFFSLAIALIVTSLFTGFKHLGYIAVVYIGLSILYAYFNLAIFDGTIMQFLNYITLPFTFLFTGFYLKYKQARG